MTILQFLTKTVNRRVGLPHFKWTNENTKVVRPTLDQNNLPESFVNYTASMVKPGAGAESSEEPVVITKPQEQSMWPYMAFLVVGGALILNM